MRALVTCFEPFGGDVENASREAARALAERWAASGVEVVVEELPVVFDGAAFERAVGCHRPDLVLCVGEAGGRTAITPERQAVNEMRARIPDNAGAQPDGEPVVVGAPEIRELKDLAEAATEALVQAGWAATTSDDAGRYVCNATAFRAYGLDVPALFVHVPALRSAGEATVGAETSGSGEAEGRAASSFEELGEALAVVLTRLATEIDRARG